MIRLWCPRFCSVFHLVLSLIGTAAAIVTYCMKCKEKTTKMKRGRVFMLALDGFITVNWFVFCLNHVVTLF